MKIKTLLSALLTLLTVSLYAQSGGVTGRVVTRVGRLPIDQAKVVLHSETPQETVTDSEGAFTFNNVAPGVYRVSVEALDFMNAETSVRVEQTMRDMNFITMTAEMRAGATLDDSSFSEFDMEDANDAQSMPVVLSATSDVFDNIASYNFSSRRYRPRGYDTSTAGVYINGIYFNDALNGYSPWSLLSGLNDATRNQEGTSALNISDYGVGGVNGTTNINARASQMRKGFRSSFVNTNSSYAMRLMASYASGELDNGWSYAFLASTRQGNNDWVNGVYYNAWGYFASVEKKLNLCHRLAFTFMGAPTIRGVQGSSTQEVYDLVGSNYYNPNWGYQDGKMRNARERNLHEPIAMLNYYYTPDVKTTLTASASFRFGRNGYSALDWYKADDPRPDYYRNLPSYFNDPVKAAWAEEGWKTDWNVRQINWNKLYETNYRDTVTFNYTGGGMDEVTTKMLRSQYVIEERRTDQRDLNLKLQYSKLLNDNSSFAAGVEYRHNRSEYYKVIKDLLGGSFWLDVDQFAERDFNSDPNANQNDLNHPNRMVKKGDKYGYDYYAHVRNAKVWATYNFNYGQWEGYLGAEGGFTKFWREGLFRKGLFPDDSEGNSRKKEFWTYTGKMGLTYKFTGTNMISANVAYIESAPYFQEAFVSPRTRNAIVDGIKNDKTFSVDLNYSLRLQPVQFRVSGYYTTIKDQNKLVSYYDDIQQAYINFSMTDIDQRHLGAEFGVRVPITTSLAASGALSYGLYKYTSNPYMTQTVDNSDQIIIDNERVYWKDYKVSNTPQTAASLALNYRSESYWFLGLDLNYFDAMYIDMNPMRRTDYALVNLNDAQIAEMTKQEKYADAFVLNADIGKSWYIQRKYNLGFSLQINNILNNKKIKTGGYEQMRLRKTTPDGGSASDAYYVPFDSKYFYMFGTSYYLNIYFRF